MTARNRNQGQPALHLVGGSHGLLLRTTSSAACCCRSAAGGDSAARHGTGNSARGEAGSAHDPVGMRLDTLALGVGSSAPNADASIPIPPSPARPTGALARDATTVTWH